jgi:flavin reductase (DIM6/NTAB) family NADH-FMN oxidoreductase RutF
MIQFNADDIDKMEYLFRINLINSCSGYKSANLIGSKSKDGIENVAIFSSITHIGSNPPMLGLFMRPTTVIRNTYENIKETGLYTINHIYNGILEDAHHTSAKYPNEVSEFDATDLSSDYKTNIQVPFVKNSPVQMLMEFVEEYVISANNTILLIGKIKELYVNEALIEKDGFINLSRGQVAAINGLDGYTIPELKTRFDYQRPKVMNSNGV